jgi:hypothetical protein
VKFFCISPTICCHNAIGSPDLFTIGTLLQANIKTQTQPVIARLRCGAGGLVRQACGLLLSGNRTMP